MMSMDTAINFLEQIHDGPTHIGEYFTNIFKDLPVGVAWGRPSQDKTDYFWDGCNEFEAQITGHLEPDKIIGKSAFERHLREEDAKRFIADDLSVINTGIPIFNRIYPYTPRNGHGILMSITKVPRYDINRNIIGNLGIFTNITGLGQATVGNVQAKLSKCFGDILQTFKNNKNYYLVKGVQTIRITTRQAEVLTYLSMGKTVKQIANLLDCAPSNIEDHVYRLKQKLGAHTTSALIDCFWNNPIKWF